MLEDTNSEDTDSDDNVTSEQKGGGRRQLEMKQMKTIHAARPGIIQTDRRRIEFHLDEARVD